MNENPHFCPCGEYENTPCDGWRRNAYTGEILGECKACKPGPNHTRIYLQHACTPECPFYPVAPAAVDYVPAAPVTVPVDPAGPKHLYYVTYVAPRPDSPRMYFEASYIQLPPLTKAVIKELEKECLARVKLKYPVLSVKILGIVKLED